MTHLSLSSSWSSHWVNYFYFFPQWLLGNVKRQMCVQSACLKLKQIHYRVNSVTPLHTISERLHHTLTSNISLKMGSTPKPEIEIQFTEAPEAWLYHFFSGLWGVLWHFSLYHSYGQDLEKILPLKLIWTQEWKHWLSIMVTMIFLIYLK